MTTIVNASTKRGQSFINAYNRANATELNEVYIKPSIHKVHAYNNCLTRMWQENGHGFRITAAGCQVFTVAWKTSEGLRVETANNSYLIK